MQCDKKKFGDVSLNIFLKKIVSVIEIKHRTSKLKPHFPGHYTIKCNAI